MIGEMWKSMPLFCLAVNKVTSDEIAWQCKHWTWSDDVHESGAALALDIGVPVWKIEESIEADYQASLKTVQNPDGGPYPAFANDKSWDETSGKTGSGKKFCHSVISGTDSAAQSSIAAIITPVIHFCVTVWKLMKIRQAWDQIRSQFQSLYTADELLKACTEQQIGWQVSSGLRGPQSRDRRNMCQEHFGRQSESHFSRGTCE